MKHTKYRSITYRLLHYLITFWALWFLVYFLKKVKLLTNHTTGLCILFPGQLPVDTLLEFSFMWSWDRINIKFIKIYYKDSHLTLPKLTDLWCLFALTPSCLLASKRKNTPPHLLRCQEIQSPDRYLQIGGKNRGDEEGRGKTSF